MSLKTEIESLKAEKESNHLLYANYEDTGNSYAEENKEVDNISETFSLSNNNISPNYKNEKKLIQENQILSKKIEETFRISDHNNCDYSSQKLLVNLNHPDHIERLNEMANRIPFEQHRKVIISLSSRYPSDNHKLLKQIFYRLIPLMTTELSLYNNAKVHFNLNDIISHFDYLIGKVCKQVLLSRFELTVVNLTKLWTYLYFTKIVVLNDCKYINEVFESEETKESQESIEETEIGLTQITFRDLDYGNEFTNIEIILSNLDKISQKLGRTLVISFKFVSKKFDNQAVQEYIHNNSLMLELKQYK